MPIDPEEPNLFVQANEANPYAEDALAQHYEYDDGVLQLPVAGPPGTPPVFIAVHGGMGRKLGVSVKTVQAWEHGANPPQDMACRFMDEIRFDPDRWIGRIKKAASRRPKPPGRRHQQTS